MGVTVVLGQEGIGEGVDRSVTGTVILALAKSATTKNSSFKPSKLITCISECQQHT